MNRGKTGFSAKTISFIKQLNPEVIFEFGAFNGADTLFYRGTFPDAKIYSFEPDPVLYKQTRLVLEEFGVSFYNYAIADITGVMDFYYLKGHGDKEERSPAGSLFVPTKMFHQSHGGQWEFVSKPIKVPCVSIKDFCQEKNIKHINYIHMDAQGAEHLVIKGMGSFRPELIYAEIEANKFYHGIPSGSQNNALFGEIGYVPIDGTGADRLYKLK